MKIFKNQPLPTYYYLPIIYLLVVSRAVKCNQQLFNLLSSTNGRSQLQSSIRQRRSINSIRSLLLNRATDTKKFIYVSVGNNNIRRWNHTHCFNIISQYSYHIVKQANSRICRLRYYIRFSTLEHNRNRVKWYCISIIFT